MPLAAFMNGLTIGNQRVQGCFWGKVIPLSPSAIAQDRPIGLACRVKPVMASIPAWKAQQPHANLGCLRVQGPPALALAFFA